MIAGSTYHSYKGDKSAVEDLIRRGADVRAAEGLNDNTPLHLALHSGQTSIAALLIFSGADLNTENKKHETPLSQISPQFIQSLMDKSIKTINSEDNDPRISSMYAQFAKTAKRFCADTGVELKDKVQIYRATRAVEDFLSNPITAETAAKYQNKIAQLSKFRSSWVKPITQAMLAIFFVSLLVVSTAIAVASCGVAVPFVAALGAVIAKAGLTAVASTIAASTITATASIYGSYKCTKFAAYHVKKNRFVNSVNAVAEVVRETAVKQP